MYPNGPYNTGYIPGPNILNPPNPIEQLNPYGQSLPNLNYAIPGAGLAGSSNPLLGNMNPGMNSMGMPSSNQNFQSLPNIGPVNAFDPNQNFLRQNMYPNQMMNPNSNLGSIPNMANNIALNDPDLKINQFMEDRMLEREKAKEQTKEIYKRLSDKYEDNEQDLEELKKKELEKEKEFQKKRKEEQRTWGIERFNNMPKCVKGKSDIYNLITLKIVDQKEMDKMLQEEKNKRQRYEIRYKVEKFYQDENMKDQDKKDNMKNGKASYQRYKEQDKRQYDIIDLKEKPFNEHKDIIKTGGISEWQKIIKGAGKNNTFDKKKIYKDPYDYSEAGSSYDIYKKSRNKIMNKLPKIESDSLFNQLRKNKRERKINISNYDSNLKTGKMDKEKFFHKEPRRINMTENNKKVMENSKSYISYAEANRLSKLFEKNKEKNMRFKQKSINLEMEKIK